MSSTGPPSENGSALPLRPALKDTQEDSMNMSPKSGPVKVVSIGQPEYIPLTTEDSTQSKQFRAGLADRRMTGRPGIPSKSSSRLSLLSQSSIDEPVPSSETSGTPRHEGKHHEGKHHIHGLHLKHDEHHAEKLLSEVVGWLQAEKAKRAARKAKKRGDEPALEIANGNRERTWSQSSDSSAVSLEALQKIIEDYMPGALSTPSPGASPRHLARRRRSSAKLLGAVSSDTEYQDGDVVVPSCDVVLDNSKTMSYTGGGAESSEQTVTLSSSKRAEKERKAWLAFKNEIVKLAHTLRLKGWRRIPLERGGDIEVERLSGALTNAVYVVSPPKDIPTPTGTEAKGRTPKAPPKLLLRIYGPQVEHLIDRENELSILRRLARKRIGPRLLGTFTNGRFEEFFESQTLTAEDLRVESTSKQIAKRMRELHDGIELLDKEREEGPFVWLNWNKWVARCEEVITYLDKEILSGKKGNGEPWRTRGLICGVEWPQFKAAIDKYSKWLDNIYGKNGVNNRLVFAHNDTQYGNILRLIPPKPTDGSAPSPLLLPQNTHKQLVVIDFEYASANTPGLEFANHFTEWCYNYHDPTSPESCNTSLYPTIVQQKTFIRSYVNHRPQFNPRASATPKLGALDSSRNSISDFYLDSRTPGGGSMVDLGASAINYAKEEEERERATEKMVNELLNEVRIWRVANSAQWVAWGIVQAKVPGLEEEEGEATQDATNSNDENATVLPNSEIVAEPSSMNGTTTPPKEDKRPEGLKAEALLQGDSAKEAEALDDEEAEFDYLAYAQDRALFFWGDLIGLGIVKKDELPEGLRERVKIVEY